MGRNFHATGFFRPRWVATAHLLRFSVLLGSEGGAKVERRWSEATLELLFGRGLREGLRKGRDAKAG
ncbi:MAG: hypothetical protein MJZ77_06360 [Bacteroidales bacterium]|nr:hypothetical protein [Bacteroidales bacterium]